MEEEVRSRFDDLDKRLQTFEKRFDDIKWYFGGAAAMFAVFISLFTIIANSNLSNERNGLQQFKNDLRADLGKAESLPDIELLGLNGQPLAGQEVRASVQKDKEGAKQFVLRYAMRNGGVGRSGLMFVKIYTNDPIHLNSLSTDEKEFKYEDFVAASSFSPNDIPGGNYTSPYTLSVDLTGDLGTGKYPILLKVYFGNGKVVQARFVVAI